MVNKKAKGKRAKTRAKFKKKAGKVTINDILKPLPKGTRVHVDIRPEMHKGMPPAVYQGLDGVVEASQGNACVVSLKKGNLSKKLVVAAVHLRLQGAKAK